MARKPHAGKPAKKSRRLLRRAGSRNLNARMGNGRTTAKSAAIAAPIAHGSALNFPVYFIFAICALYSLQLGILEPYFNFQVAPQQSFSLSSCPPVELQPSANAYASGNELLIYLPRGLNSSTLALFSGSGGIGTARVEFSEPGMALGRISIGGKTICTQCESGRAYPVGHNSSGQLQVEVESAENGSPSGALDSAQQGTGLAFFVKSAKTHARAPLSIYLTGSFRVVPNNRIPSSFYGEDSPFHMGRTAILASYLAEGKWPWAAYSFVSVLPPALFYMATGFPHEYAYKVCEILLFFIPVVIFYFYSRKLEKFRDAAFSIASLAHLFLPSLGYPVGGGTDIFVYGMTAQIAATYLSLACFLFAYEFVFENLGRGALLLSAASFALAFECNQRIALPLLVGFALLGLAAIVKSTMKRKAGNRNEAGTKNGEIWRLLVLLIACAAISGWLAYRFWQDFDIGGYMVLGGVAPGPWPTALALLFQAGFGALPFFFAVGVWAAWKEGNQFAVLVSAYCAAMFLVCTSPELAAAFPFVDSLRLLPSFFLPFLFVSALGIAHACRMLWHWLLGVGKRLSLHRDVLAVAVMLALVAPVSLAMFGTAHMTMEDYAAMPRSLSSAADYLSDEKATMLAGNERMAMIGASESSQYPVFDAGLERTFLPPDYAAGTIATVLSAGQYRYLLVGNTVTVRNESGDSADQLLAAIGSNPRFAKVLDTGTAWLFALNGASPAPDVYGSNVSVESAVVSYDSASVSGECRADRCEVLVYSRTLPLKPGCLGEPMPCSASYDTAIGAMKVDGISRGRFSFTLAPRHDPVEMLLVALGAIALAVCLYLA